MGLPWKSPSVEVKKGSGNPMWSRRHSLSTIIRSPLLSIAKGRREKRKKEEEQASGSPSGMVEDVIPEIVRSTSCLRTRFRISKLAIQNSPTAPDRLLSFVVGSYPKSSPLFESSNAVANFSLFACEDPRLLDGHRHNVC
ncbi:hypothetical protein HPP92_022835 [Vanilla planifolia]|uniref:Uncharacterized protein n=1 Tax=Vanilla planifolia TaxID=51239 RepID=A0A835PY86_VANPL|nr:hypothetical protein HPP92_023124 [Vanilla planifolia]KAG0459707.1 hypothetical protein HPP92_022835 [Vanilla planifolia]